MAAKWEGLDIEFVKEDWRKDLENCSLGQIGYAVEASRKEQHPPNIGLFLDFCKRFNPEQPKAIERKFTDEEMSANRERAKNLMKITARRVGNTDWARKIIRRIESCDKSVPTIAAKFAREVVGFEAAA